MSTRRLALALFAATLLAGPVGAAGQAAVRGAALPVLRLDGVGPVSLGMTEVAAVKTGWLAKRDTGCPLGGPPLPVTLRFTGPKAPPGLGGIAEFVKGRLINLSFTAGVRTTAGVEVGRTTFARMVQIYRGKGFTASARYDDVFVGTFVTAERGGRTRIGAFADGSDKRIGILAVPHVPLCD
jgi:hypothetical protein